MFDDGTKGRKTLSNTRQAINYTKSIIKIGTTFIRHDTLHRGGCVSEHDHWGGS